MKQFFVELWSGQSWKATVVLLLSPLILTTWKYFASYTFLRESLPDLPGVFIDKSQAAELLHFGLSLILLGLLPCGIVKWVFRESLRDYGLQFGEWRGGMLAFGLLLPFFLLAAYTGANDPQVCLEYPLDKQAGQGFVRFAIHALGYFLFYVGWEIYFRGFMQVGLRTSMGAWNAILVQTLASCLLHIGKPTGEIYGSIVAGILWGLIAHRTRSIVCGLMLHATLGITLDLVLSLMRR